MAVCPCAACLRGVASAAISIAVSGPQLQLLSVACAPTDSSQVVAFFMHGDPTLARINSALHYFATGRLTPPCNAALSLLCALAAPTSNRPATLLRSRWPWPRCRRARPRPRARPARPPRHRRGWVLCSAAAVVATDAGGESSRHGGIVCSKRQRGRSEKRRTQTRQHHDRSRHKRWHGASGKHKDKLDSWMCFLANSSFGKSATNAAPTKFDQQKTRSHQGKC